MTVAPAWFARVGTPISEHDRSDAAAILGARGFPVDAPVVLIPSWRAAALWTNDVAMAECWDDDEDEREALWTRAAADLGESTLLAQLTAATASAAPQVRSAAQAAAGGVATADPEAMAIAAASALLALHQCVLAQLVRVAPGHVFLHKYALYARGRWALGYRDGTYGIL
ncbi:MAG: hypothetical protein ABI777_08235 [Betaproteobacteria bacterium]